MCPNVQLVLLTCAPPPPPPPRGPRAPLVQVCCCGKHAAAGSAGCLGDDIECPRLPSSPRARSKVEQ
eukprot:8479548-Alexandrium_andersonii.AAC.1